MSTEKTASHFALIQYVPNPEKGERINIGAIAFDGNVTSICMADGWEKRAKKFGDGDLKYVYAQLDTLGQMTAVEIVKAANDWGDCVVQLSSPKAASGNAQSQWPDLAAKLLGKQDAYVVTFKAHGE